MVIYQDADEQSWKKGCPAELLVVMVIQNQLVKWLIATVQIVQIVVVPLVVQLLVVMVLLELTWVHLVVELLEHLVVKE